MKKKIICLVSAITFSLILFCIPAFAYNQSYSATFSPDYAYLASVDESEYTSSVDENNRQILVVSFKSDYPLNARGFDVYFDYVGQDISSGDRFVGNLNVVFQSGSYTEYSTVPYSLFYANINGGGWVPFGDVTISKMGLVSGVGYAYKISLSFDYIFSSDVTDLKLAIFMSTNGEIASTDELTFTFDQYISNFYLGSSTSPEAPQYSNPSDKYSSNISGTKDDLDDYSDLEQDVIGSTEEGQDEVNSLFDSLSDLVPGLYPSLMAVTEGMNYFIGGSTLLSSILYISLALGLVLFLFNAASSLSHSRSRSEPRNTYVSRKGGGS